MNEEVEAGGPRHQIAVPRGDSGPRFVPLVLTPEERGILLAEARDDEISIRPDNGALYIPEVHLRGRLNEAFGPGQWTLWQNAPAEYRPELHEVIYDATLLIRESAVARAVGSCRCNPDDKWSMPYSNAAEAAKAQVLRRCLKDMGAYSEMWDKPWCAAWKFANASLYEVVELGGAKNGEISKEWYRNDNPPRDSKRRQYRKLFGNAQSSAPAPQASRGLSGSGNGGHNASSGSQPSRPEQSSAPAASDRSANQPSIRDPESPATDKQIAALEKMCAKLDQVDVAGQLRERGAGCLRELTKGEASVMFQWAKSQLGGG